MPTDHAEVSMADVRVGSEALFGPPEMGLELAQHFVHENRIRQAASSLGAAQFCINEAVRYSNERITWGKKLSVNQGIQFPLVELHTEAAMLRQLIRYTATMLDQKHHMEVTHLVAMCNYRANRLACDAADRAMQTCGESATAAICRSSTFIVTIADTASQKGLKRFRCAKWPATYLDSRLHKTVSRLKNNPYTELLSVVGNPNIRHT